MKHYILYYHGGSSNHGCEALVRTTAGLLDYRSNKVTLSSFSPESDKRFNIDKICDIHAMFESKPISKFDLRFINAYRKLKINKDGTSLDDLSMLNAIGARKGDGAPTCLLQWVVLPEPKKEEVPAAGTAAEASAAEAK